MTQNRVTDPLPLITIGITCYNAADTISRALNSAVSQDWQNLEIIVVDDVSQDGSVAMIQQFIGNLKPGQPPVRLVRHNANGGPAAARNTLLQEAQGEFIAFFDDDDESFPARARTQYERISAYEAETGVKLIACYASGTRAYPNGYSVDLSAIGAREPVPHGPGMADRLLFFGGPKNWHYGGTPTCSLMLRLSVCREIGGFDAHLRRTEDIDFAVRLALAGGHFIGCREKLFIQHATWGADKAADKNLDSELQIVEKQRHYLENIGMYVYARDWPKIRYHHFRKEYPAMLAVLLRLWLRYPLRVTRHFLTTGPARLLHEIRMKRPAQKLKT